MASSASRPGEDGHVEWTGPRQANHTPVLRLNGRVRTAARHEARIAEVALNLALTINELVPGSRKGSEAITHLEMATGWALSGVDRRFVPRGTHEPQPGEAGDGATLRSP
ncbi:hypothetical protein ACIRST_39045 [Kitasatospora sp. NPDC101447]|uniref:hypothetical protein n=1 Tax=Kitasatospora sp. NPDC101447 TaxID=3364102 RepID=UPI003817BF14